ncbi:MAG: hypothetical protein QXP80_01655 [Zestosphaera sp.]
MSSVREDLDYVERTHVVRVCRERCAELPFKTREEFTDCVDSCVKELTRLTHR